MPDSAPQAQPELTQEHPEVFCKRCQHRFVCVDPELSGAVDCPGCSRVAWLSKDDETKVRDAANRQLKDGSYSRRFIERRSVHLKAVALLPETREHLARLAHRLRRGSVETCPSCLYNLAGVLKGDEPIPCPECGEQTSRPINTFLWGQRANESRFNRKFALYAGLVVGGTYWLVRLLGYVLEDVGWLYGFLEFLLFLTIVVLIGLPFGVSVAASRWLRLRNPTMNQGLVVLAALGYASINLVAALLLIYLIDIVIDWL